MTTVVRPSEADLSAIARRITGPLTPEGAESWYRNDSVTLLQEVALLRQEAEVARKSFYEDGARAEPDAPLYEWAKAWKATATGYWEKEQTKALREQLAAQRIAVANYKKSLAASEDAYRVLAEDKTAADAQLAEARQALTAGEQTHEVERARLLRQIAELEGQVAQSKEETVQARSAAQRDIETLKARNEEQLARARELMDRAMGSL